MMGQHDRSEALFYYFRLEDQVPETHLLRLIEKHISFAFVREKLKESYSETGRPSIDPELLLRILLIGYLYGITSERKLVEELRMHLAWRWFTGLGFDQEIPHHSTFSKNRHGRFQESKLFEQLFEEIVGTLSGSGTGARRKPWSHSFCRRDCRQGEKQGTCAVFLEGERDWRHVGANVLHRERGEDRCSHREAESLVRLPAPLPPARILNDQ